MREVGNPWITRFEGWAQSLGNKMGRLCKADVMLPPNNLI